MSESTKSSDYRTDRDYPQPKHLPIAPTPRNIIRDMNVLRYRIGVECPECKHDAVFHVQTPDARAVSLMNPEVDKLFIMHTANVQRRWGRWRCLHTECNCTHNALEGGKKIL
jgi:hypothetical protein